VSLTPKQLETVRSLAREGNREVVIRTVLGVSHKDWRRLKEGDDSPLVEALEAGRAEGAGGVISFMREQMGKGSMQAAMWLGEHVYRVTKPGPDEVAPRVAVNLVMVPAPMTNDEFRQLVDVTPGRKALSHD
jgi:hypothetical protein